MDTEDLRIKLIYTAIEIDSYLVLQQLQYYFPFELNDLPINNFVICNGKRIDARCDSHDGEGKRNTRAGEDEWKKIGEKYRKRNTKGCRDRK